MGRYKNIIFYIKSIYKVLARSEKKPELVHNYMGTGYEEVIIYDLTL